jgi:formylglycine-generating enzyme required for sulfatase activity
VEKLCSDPSTSMTPLWEWCQDWWGDYPGGTALDPQGPATGSYRVVRGGSWGDWFDSVRDCRSAGRYAVVFPGDWGGLIGFRVLLAPGQP